MLGLPDFLGDADAPAGGGDSTTAFALTGFFFTRHVSSRAGSALAGERAHFIAALERALPSVA